MILRPTETTGSEFRASGQIQILVNMPNGAAWTSNNVVTLQVKSPHEGDTDVWVDTDVTWDEPGINTALCTEDLTYRLSVTTAGPHASHRRLWTHTK